MPLARLLSLAGAVALALSPADAADVVFKIADTEGRPVADAVVSLIPLDTQPPAPAPSMGVQIVQEKEQFVPLVTVVTAGSSVAFLNRETGKTEHQIYSVSPAKKFEIGLHKPGNTSSIVFEQSGVVAVGCSLHMTMNAYVVVATTPWFGKSAADGSARIVSPPAGRYRAEVWHPRLDTTQYKENRIEIRTITLPASLSDASFALKLKPEPRVRRILDGGSGGYK